jgi:hypothetical protein
VLRRKRRTRARFPRSIWLSLYFDPRLYLTRPPEKAISLLEMPQVERLLGDTVMAEQQKLEQDPGRQPVLAPPAPEFCEMRQNENYRNVDAYLAMANCDTLELRGTLLRVGVALGREREQSHGVSRNSVRGWPLISGEQTEDWKRRGLPYTSAY